MTHPPTTIPIPLARPYDVVVGPHILPSLGDRIAALFGARNRAFLVFDGNLPVPLVDEALASLTGAGFGVAEEAIRASEAEKSLATAERLLSHLARTRHERTDPVVALGGGVVGDVAGFVAAVYRRGVPVIQCPTTLLAMVDASVGGKTGVNLPTPTGLRKNMVGVFWQPALVLADVESLRSLPDRELRAGLAECLKHGLVAAGVGVQHDLFEWTLRNLGAILARDADALTELVRRNVAVKARVVAGDEREEAPSGGSGGAPGGGGGSGGGRALLNLGHTFAHAIETIPSLTPDGDPAHAPLLHGEAVALGLVAAAACARELGRLTEADLDRLRAALTSAGLPVAVAGLPADEALIEAMSHDKKVAAGRLRLVLPKKIGAAEVVDGPPESAVRAGLSAIRA